MPQQPASRDCRMYPLSNVNEVLRYVRQSHQAEAVSLYPDMGGNRLYF